MDNYPEKISGVTVSPGIKGQFDVEIDGSVVFSKQKESRFPEYAEIEAKVKGA